MIVGTILGGSKEPVLGIIGGFGPETTVEFFAKVLALSRLRKFKPKMVIANAAVPDKFEAQGINGDVSPIVPFVIECIDKLNSAGVDFMVLPCNTLHILIKKFRKASRVPMISIIDVAISELKQRKMSSVGLLGTTATVESEMFQKEFANFGIKTLIPNCDEQGSVTNLIGNVLKTGVVCEKDRQFLRDLINTLENRGAECVLLACTDLQLFVKPDGLKIFDTMDLLAKECVNTLLKLKQK